MHAHLTLRLGRVREEGMQVIIFLASWSTEASDVKWQRENQAVRHDGWGA